MDYIYHIGVFILLYAILAQSANIIQGYAGLYSMGYAAFYAFGAYASALISVRLGWNFFAGMGFGMVLAGVTSALLAIPLMRIRKIYLLVFTQAFQVIIYELLLHLKLTMGSMGIFGIPRPKIFGMEIQTPLNYLVFYFFISLVCLIIAWWLMRSPFGRVLKAIREDFSATQSLGKNVFNFNILAFVIGGVMSAVAGSCYAHYITYINPNSFTIHVTFMIIVFVVLGGTANFWGAILGAVIVMGVPEALRFLPGAAGIIDCIREMLYGFLLMLFIFFRPVGIIPESYKKSGRIRRPSESSPEESGNFLSGQNGSSSIGSQNPSQPILEVKGISKSFGGLQAVKDVSMTLPAGKITALVGPNGCGKTTLFNMISGFLPPDAGSVCIQGKDVTKTLPHRIVGKGVARSWQDTRIFSRMAVIDNVMLAFPKQTGERLLLALLFPKRVVQEENENYGRAIAYLGLVGLADKAHEVAGDLSSAEQKLVALARLLATECPLLLIDEPTAGLDPESVRRIGRVIQQIVNQGKRTVLLVEHNLDVIRELAENVHFMDEGQIIASGSPAELMVNPKLTEVYFGI